MNWEYENEFRNDHPETIGETDYEFDLDNYREWLEKKLNETRQRLKELKKEIQ